MTHPRTLILLLILSALTPTAHAAKMLVKWTPPTMNSDGSPLLDLTGYRIEWGSCNADGSIDVYQAGLNVGVPAIEAYIYPTGLKMVCAHMFAISASHGLSLASNNSSAPVPPTLSQPRSN